LFRPTVGSLQYVRQWEFWLHVSFSEHLALGCWWLGCRASARFHLSHVGFVLEGFHRLLSLDLVSEPRSVVSLDWRCSVSVAPTHCFKDESRGVGGVKLSRLNLLKIWYASPGSYYRGPQGFDRPLIGAQSHARSCRHDISKPSLDTT